MSADHLRVRKGGSYIAVLFFLAAPVLVLVLGATLHLNLWVKLVLLLAAFAIGVKILERTDKLR